MAFCLNAQDDGSKDRDLRIEIEPSSFFLRGASGSVLYNVTSDNALSLGLYSASIDIPMWSRAQMFDGVSEDTTDVRLGFEIALMARYKFKLFEQWESNPYIGLIAGWEYFDVKPQSLSSVRLGTFIVTPHVGYEFYFFKQMLYVNPHLRSVFYLGSTTSDESRPERMSSFFMMPMISMGVRL